jgi:hypothetical protein
MKNLGAPSLYDSLLVLVVICAPLFYIISVRMKFML